MYAMRIAKYSLITDHVIRDRLMGIIGDKALECGPKCEEGGR
jgi:hypothetical protein